MKSPDTVSGVPYYCRHKPSKVQQYVRLYMLISCYNCMGAERTSWSSPTIFFYACSHWHGRPQLFWKGGARIGQGGRHLAAVNTLSAFGRFNERGVLSAFGRFNERGGCCPLSADLTSGGGGGGGGRGGGGAVRFRPI